MLIIFYIFQKGELHVCNNVKALKSNTLFHSAGKIRVEV